MVRLKDEAPGEFREDKVIRLYDLRNHRFELERDTLLLQNRDALNEHDRRNHQRVLARVYGVEDALRPLGKAGARREVPQEGMGIANVEHESPPATLPFLEERILRRRDITFRNVHSPDESAQANGCLPRGGGSTFLQLQEFAFESGELLNVSGVHRGFHDFVRFVSIGITTNSPRMNRRRMPPEASR